MTPTRLLVAGFLLALGAGALQQAIASAGLPYRERLTGPLKHAGWMGFAFYMAFTIIGSFVTPAVGLVAGVFGYERRRELDERQHRALERIVELDEILAAPPIRDDPEAREEQEERKAKAAKKRARIWKRFVEANQVKILPRWFTRAEEYVIAGGPLVFLGWMLVGGRGRLGGFACGPAVH